ncbi:MAG: signal peptidase I [Candidatus Kerfeldbacteria bacterium]|nr:signal peptidase I [Candidatus Kerfeldbacteria bacterium]
MKITPDKETIAREPKAEQGVPDYAKSPRGFLVELIKIVLIAVVIIIPIRYFLFQPFYVRGASMEPNFHDNEYLIIDEITYRFTEPQRGEIVVVRDPKNHAEFLIKRIIGLPGETIQVIEGNVYIYNQENPEGKILSEPYLFSHIVTTHDQRVEVGSDEYFVMGDNRPVSLDSRSFGPILKKNIVGRAWLRVWPFETFTHFSVPSYSTQSQ